MRTTILATITLLVLVCACNSSPTKTNQQKLVVTTEGDSLKLRRVLQPNDSGYVFVSFVDGRLKEHIRKDSSQVVFIEFDPGDSTRLRARLSSPDSLANVRISQILMPDSTADGPFGSELDYALPQRGIYHLVVNENMMAGDPWAGIFVVEMELGN